MSFTYLYIKVYACVLNTQFPRIICLQVTVSAVASQVLLLTNITCNTFG